MEINKLGEEIIGVVNTNDVVEGRFGLLTTVSAAWNYDFGSRVDLPGWKVPATVEEAKRAKYCITWAVDNRPTPILNPMPARTYTTRNGFGQAVQTPFSASVYLTHMSNQESLTIPSGVPALAMNEGIFTFPESCFINTDATIRNPGAMVIVANTAEDAVADVGKLKVQSSMDARVVGIVLAYDSSAKKLTVQTFD